VERQHFSGANGELKQGQAQSERLLVLDPQKTCDTEFFGSALDEKFNYLKQEKYFKFL